MEVLFCFVLLLAAMTGHSTATYCLCKDGQSDAALQKTLDYACGSGADCTPILQNGACYLPNTLRDHCSYAANSYYQKKTASGATCDFSGTATSSQTLPTVASGCVYPSSPRTSVLFSQITAGTSPTTPSSTTNSNTSTGLTPPFGIGISPSGTIGDGNGSAREKINFFNAVAALICWSVGYLAWE